jgi:hypothetical protein
MSSANEISSSRCHPHNLVLSSISFMPQAINFHIDLLPSSIAQNVRPVPVRCSTCNSPRHNMINQINVNHCTQSSRTTWKFIVSNSIAQSIQLTKNNQSRCIHPCSHRNPCTQSHRVISRYAKQNTKQNPRKNASDKLHCTAPHRTACNAFQPISPLHRQHRHASNQST